MSSILDTYEKEGRKHAAKFDLRGRNIVWAAAKGTWCSESYPCQHPGGYWLRFDDGSEEQCAGLGSAEFAFFVEALGYVHALDSHFADYIPVERRRVFGKSKCDGCGRCPIDDDRWKCRQCPDFDFCGECVFTKRHDNGHTFVYLPHQQ